MELTCLGHAMWLATVGELRLLFDPLLGQTHHGDVFELRPRRRIEASALAPDFIVVSHRHPDHFDVPSLHRLAQLDRDSVVLTSDPLVERTARAVGFSTVARVDALHRIELEGAALLTTPSFGAELEWGVMISSADGVVYNQVDTVMRHEADVRRVLDTAAAGLGRPALRDGVDLALVRWQPAREVEAAIAGDVGFPFAAYAALLDQVAAMHPKAAIPASAGCAHAARYADMNRVVYPLDGPRFRRDLQARCPGVEVMTDEVGAVTRVTAGEVSRVERRAGFVEVEDERLPFRFEPQRLSDLVDDDDRPSGELHERSRRWIDDRLVPALARVQPELGMPRVVLALDVVGATETERYVLVMDESGVRRGTTRDGDDYDVFNAITASDLVDVVEGRRHWGEPLLGGRLRAVSRDYRVSPDGLVRAQLAPIFLYYALSYDESHERWVDHQLAELGCG